VLVKKESRCSAEREKASLEPQISYDVPNDEWLLQSWSPSLRTSNTETGFVKVKPCLRIGRGGGLKTKKFAGRPLNMADFFVKIGTKRRF